MCVKSVEKGDDEGRCFVGAHEERSDVGPKMKGIDPQSQPMARDRNESQRNERRVPRMKDEWRLATDGGRCSVGAKGERSDVDRRMNDE